MVSLRNLLSFGRVSDTEVRHAAKSGISFREIHMARDGYLIIDSDLHFNEPGDLWERYLEAPHNANPPRFFGGSRRR